MVQDEPPTKFQNALLSLYEEQARSESGEWLSKTEKKSGREELESEDRVGKEGTVPLTSFMGIRALQDLLMDSMSLMSSSERVKSKTCICLKECYVVTFCS